MGARDDTDPYQGHDPGCICADCCAADMAIVCSDPVAGLGEYLADKFRLGASDA